MIYEVTALKISDNYLIRCKNDIMEIFTDPLEKKGERVGA